MALRRIEIESVNQFGTLGQQSLEPEEPGLHFGTNKGNRVSNADLLYQFKEEGIVLKRKNSQKVFTSPDELKHLLGIDYREVCRAKSHREGVMQMAIEACEEALGPIDRKRIKFIVAAISNPVVFDPKEERKHNLSNALKSKLGLTNAIGFDTYGYCSGALKQLDKLKVIEEEIEGEEFILVAVDKLSTYLKMKGCDPFNRAIFSDKAVAMRGVYGRDITILYSNFREDLGKNHLIKMYQNPAFKGLYDIVIPHTRKGFEMEGPAVMRYIERAIPAHIRETAANAGINIADLAGIAPSQNNGRVVPVWQERIPETEVFNYSADGNAAVASAVLTLKNAYEEGKLADGDVGMITAPGAGMTRGAAIFGLGERGRARFYELQAA